MISGHGNKLSNKIQTRVKFRPLLLGYSILILMTVSLPLAVHADERRNSEDVIDFFHPEQGISVDNVKDFSAAYNISVSTEEEVLQKIDKNGYILYCPCMGRFGNQAEQLIGSLAFAKGLNRTLVLPPWIVYPSSSPFRSELISFSRWFDVDNLKQYHKVIAMEDFMEKLAPIVWPKGRRYGFCYLFRNGKLCAMKEGNPFGPFWDSFGINFDNYFDHKGILWNTDDTQVVKEWLQRFPPNQYPVLAFQGAPGDFPSRESNQDIQKFLQFSILLRKLSDQYIKKEMKGGDFVAIHLRNGRDMLNACKEIKKGDLPTLFCSQQCTGYRGEKKLTYEMCAPSKKNIIRKVKKYLKKLKVKRLFIGTDNDPMIKDFKKVFKDMEVSFHRRLDNDEKDDPIVDIAIMSQATYFIGNCVSSFSSFVRRQRNVAGKAVDFFGTS